MFFYNFNWYFFNSFKCHFPKSSNVLLKKLYLLQKVCCGVKITVLDNFFKFSVGVGVALKINIVIFHFTWHLFIFWEIGHTAHKISIGQKIVELNSCSINLFVLLQQNLYFIFIFDCYFFKNEKDLSQFTIVNYLLAF